MKFIFLFVCSLSFALAKVNVAVSILPQETFVKKIGGDKVSVMTLVEPGASPTHMNQNLPKWYLYQRLISIFPYK